VSSIKDLLDEEKEAEGLLKDSEQKADAIVRDARTKASDLIGKAQSDDVLVRELTERNKERISVIQAEIQSKCDARAAETEMLCQRNLEAAVELVVDNVLGASNER
jgi:vacuolar-type H+-ATPase subunit H